MLVKKATMTKITYRYFNYTHYINTIKSSSSNKNNNQRSSKTRIKMSKIKQRMLNLTIIYEVQVVMGNKQTLIIHMPNNNNNEVHALRIV